MDTNDPETMGGEREWAKYAGAKFKSSQQIQAAVTMTGVSTVAVPPTGIPALLSLSFVVFSHSFLSFFQQTVSAHSVPCALVQVLGHTVSQIKSQITMD